MSGPGCEDIEESRTVDDEAGGEEGRRGGGSPRTGDVQLGKLNPGVINFLN